MDEKSEYDATTLLVFRLVEQGLADDRSEKIDLDDLAEISELKRLSEEVDTHLPLLYSTG
jgi:hypothetical protein